MTVRYLVKRLGGWIYPPLKTTARIAVDLSRRVSIANILVPQLRIFLNKVAH